MNPDIQEKIYEEICDTISMEDSIDHENINQLIYLEAAIEENLRMFPPVTRLDRQCNSDATVGNFLIKKGINIIFPIWALQHNPEFFPEPESFKPERFLKDGNQNKFHPYAYIPFGGGPRKCIGMRFAMVEMKIALAKLLKKFKIVKVPQTKLDFYKGDMFFLTYGEVQVRLESRN